LLDHARGDLPNDRRHNLKLFGSYSSDGGFELGANLWFRSGRPVNGFGVHPTDPWARRMGNRAFYNNGAPCPRGHAGTTDPSWALDLMLGFRFRAWGAEAKLRLDVFNLFDNDVVTQVDEYAELASSQPNPNYLLPRHHQPPRTVRLGFAVDF
jgi:outer membrane receptor protein involved in Fe transport